MSSSEGNSKGDENAPQTKSNILQQSKFSLKSSMLRPSLFFASAATTSDTTLSNTEKTGFSSTNEKENTSGESTKTAVNPFKNDHLDHHEGDAKKVKAIEPGESSPIRDENDKKPDPLTPLTQLAKNGMPKSSLFSNVSSTITENSGFVFGQNVHERVIAENMQPTVATAPLNTENLFSASSSNSNSVSGTSLFANSLSASTDPKPEQATENGEASSKKDTDSLVEAARKYEESRGAQKRKYDEVETVTGEEDERNILEINCKLFAFLSSNYEERGRGALRVNDSKKQGSASRVVFRTSGVLRVLMNTKIWAGMIAEPASQKSLRLTAIDNDGHIKVFLVMARPDDISQLHAALSKRIHAEKLKATENAKVTDKEPSDTPSQKKALLDAGSS